MREQNGIKITLNAAAATDLSGNANLGHGIDIDANGDAVLVSGAASDDYVGCLYDGGRVAGDPVAIVCLGPALGVAGGAYNEGDWLAMAADAEYVQLSAAGAVAGKALQDGADQDLAWILVLHCLSDDGAP